jgi:hypothetical protein
VLVPDPWRAYQGMDRLIFLAPDRFIFYFDKKIILFISENNKVKTKKILCHTTFNKFIIIQTHRMNIYIHIYLI